MSPLSGKNVIVGIGSALIDILVHEDDGFLNKIGAVKGGMALVEDEFIEKALNETDGRPSMVPGGSACNTIVGVGRLGGAGRFVGKCGKDELGKLFEEDLKANDIDPVLFKSSSPTGRVLSIITPDAQRSMFTFLGASSETTPEEISEECFADAAIVHIEGYLLYSMSVIMAALKGAKENGALVSLDLASFTVVEEFYDQLKDIASEYVDILIANEDEARAFTGYSDESRSLKALSEYADTAVLKVGKKGSYINGREGVVSIEPMGDGRAVDTTGAGDLWASGFLFGLVNGYSLEACGRLGSACGYEVCRVTGASIPDDGWQRIRNLI